MIDYDEFDTEGMDDIGKASVEYVQSCMSSGFENIFGSNKEFDPTHLLIDVDWYEGDRIEDVYPVLLCEPIEDMPNNLVCLCPPFNKEKFL